MAPEVVAIIPARLGSTRFPAKVLASRTGKPLIQHVCEAVQAAKAASSIVVATDDERIAEVVRSFGGSAIMTSSAHVNGTSRLAEAAQLLRLSADDIIINCQGDEPELEASAITGAVSALTESGADMGTVASPFGASQDPADPNIVKVVVSTRGTALYFSRAPIPHARAGGAPAPALRHVGIYTYRRSFLERYASLPPTPLERSEQLEQLRALEHGHTIAVAIRETHHHGVDTPEQYEAFVRRWKARQSQ